MAALTGGKRKDLQIIFLHPVSSLLRISRTDKMPRMSQPPGRYSKLTVAVVGVVIVCLWVWRGADVAPGSAVQVATKPVPQGGAKSPVQSPSKVAPDPNVLPISPPRILASRLTPLVDITSLKKGGSQNVGGNATQDAAVPAEVAGARLMEKRESAPDGQGIARRVSIYETDFKYPYLRVEEQWMRNAQGQDVVVARAVMVADHFLIRLQDGWNEQQLTSHLADLGLTIRRHLPKSAFYIAAMPKPEVAAYDHVLEALSQGKGPAAYAEPDFIAKSTAGPPVYPNDSSFSLLWGMNNTGQTGGVADADIDAPEAWAVTTGSGSVVVAVIDSGVNYNHPDLAANMWTNPGEIAGNNIDDDNNGYVDDVRGYDFFNMDANPMDDNGHGTHVAGTVGAVGGNGAGVAGVCHTVRIIPLKFLGANGQGALSDAVEAINYATNEGVLLSSCSWGGGGYTQALKDVIDDAGAAGIGCVVAAGNSATNNDVIPGYPSSYDSPNIIAVAATNATDALSNFSSYGATTVDLSAPGEGIYSTTMDGSYGVNSGTSMATPHVSGACALLKAANPSLTFAAIKDALLSQVDPITALTGKCVTGGRLNLAKALVPATGSFLHLTQVTVDDGSLNGAQGNDDGIISPGETFTLVLGIKNSGATLSPGVNGVLSLRTPNASLTLAQTTAVYGDMASYATADNAAAPFLISVAPGTTTPTEIPLRLTLTDGAAKSWTEDFALHVYTASTVSGLVTKVTGGGPLENATIKLVGTINQTVTTDETGHYTATVVDGAYAVQALAPGFIPSEKAEVTVPPAAADVDFVLGFSDLQVTPTVLTQVLMEEEVKTQTLLLENHGDQPLTYRVDEVPDLSALNLAAAAKPYTTKKKPLAKARRAQEGFFQRTAPATLSAAGEVSIANVGLPFSDGFESGNIDKWFDSGGNGAREVVKDTAARGTHSFHLHNDGPDDHLTGIHQVFNEGTKPGYVSFHVRPGSDDLATCYFVLGDVYFVWLADFIWFFANDNGRFYINDDVGGNQAVIYQPNQWYHIEFRDVDWTLKTFDYYVDGVLVQADIPFRNADIAQQCRLAFAYNYNEDTDAWWDEVFFGEDALYWMNLSKQRGTIPPGGSETIAVTFDATTLFAGTYKGKVMVTSNDPGAPEVTVPVTLQVNALPNEPPVATSQSLTQSEDSWQTITLTGTDPDNNPLTARITSLPLNGQLYQYSEGAPGAAITTVQTLVTDPDRRVIFVPGKNEHANLYATFQFVLKDKKLDSAPATITLEVQAQADVPLAEEDRASVLPGESFPDIAVLLNDVDPDGGTLNVTAFTQPQRGTVTDVGNGVLRYTPGVTFAFGTDTFEYTVSNGVSQSVGTVTVSRGYLQGGGWSTYGNGTARTGYYPGKTGGKLFAPLWDKTVGYTPLPAAVADGTIYLTLNDSSFITEVGGFNLTDGEVAWSSLYFADQKMTQPTYADGSLYLQRPSPYGNSELLRMTASSGAVEWSKAYTSNANISFKSPLVTRDAVFLPGGGPGGFASFDHSGGRGTSQSFTEGGGWTTTLGGGRVWSATMGVVRSHDVGSGALRDLITPVASAGNATVVYEAESARGFVNLSGRIQAVTPGATSPVWSSAASGYVGTPAVSHGRVYAMKGSPPYGVDALDSITGVVLKIYAMNSAGEDQPVVCEDSLIVSTGGQTYIFRLTDAALMQLLPYGGAIALADGHLVLSSSIVKSLRVYTAPAALGVSPQGGSFMQPVEVTFNASLPSAAIRYTTNGTTPGASSASMALGGSMRLERSTLVKAMTAIGEAVSDVVTASFTITDTDGDGLPDWWESSQSQGATPTGLNPLADDDHDGMTDIQEFVAGTNAAVPDRFEASVVAGDSSTTVSWKSQQGRFYTVESSIDLENWSEVATAKAGTGAVMTYEGTAPAAGQARFYRVQVSLP